MGLSGCGNTPVVYSSGCAWDAPIRISHEQLYNYGPVDRMLLEDIINHNEMLKKASENKNE